MARMLRVCRLLPPRKSFVALSSSSTRAPARRAVIAAHSPALPPPTIRTSTDDLRSAMRKTFPPRRTRRADPLLHPPPRRGGGKRWGPFVVKTSLQFRSESHFSMRRRAMPRFRETEIHYCARGTLSSWRAFSRKLESLAWDTLYGCEAFV